MEGLLNRLHIAQPKYVDPNRIPCIPESVRNRKLIIAKRTKMNAEIERNCEKRRKLERDIEEEMGDDYVLDLKKHYDIEAEEKYDCIPEIWEGHNVADYIDPDIFNVSANFILLKCIRLKELYLDNIFLSHFLFQKLTELEKEEQLREEAGMYDYKVPELSETMREIEQLAKQIRDKKAIMKDEARITKASTKPVMPRTAAAKVRDRSVTKLKEQMEDLGVDMEGAENVSITYEIYKLKSVTNQPCVLHICIYIIFGKAEYAMKIFQNFLTILLNNKSGIRVKFMLIIFFKRIYDQIFDVENILCCKFCKE